LKVRQMFLQKLIGLICWQNRDDDTYFLSLDSLNRVLSKYNPLEYHLIGASSESRNANKHFGRKAFGGAGIFLSRGLMAKMNMPGAFEGCFEEFGHEFGGLSDFFFFCTSSPGSRTSHKC
jgi:hypothetical protein